MHDWKNSAKGVLAGGLTGIVLGLVGFLLAEIPGTHAMGEVMFFLVPLGAGFAIAMVAQKPSRAAAAAILSTIVSLIVLITTGTETLLCAVLVLPLLFVGLFAGI